MAATSMVSIDAAIALVLLAVESISLLKGGQKNDTEAFLDGNNVFALLPSPDCLQ